ncbi:Glycosyl_transferase family 2 protein [Hexamita inflata]|uniref:Glycosyl_transferase family 2 protein n=1 Tax=Hexamita inflata TaxID=28002 RepID=A0ABP1GF16_9EUKA
MIPHVNVLIPVYNKEKYIIYAIISVLNQNYQNLSITLVDDFSSDNSVKVIEKFIYGYSNIRLIKNNQNYGTLYSRYLATQVSSDYTLFLDADDYLLPNTINTLVIALGGSNPDIVWFQMQNNFHNFVPNLNCTSGKALFDKINQLNTPFTYLIGKMIKTSAFTQSLYALNVLVSNKLVLGEDFLVMSQIFSQNISVTSVSFIGYVRTRNPDQVTLTPNIQRYFQDYFNRRVGLTFLRQIESTLNLSHNSLCTQIWWDINPVFELTNNCTLFLQMINSWGGANCKNISRWMFSDFVHRQRINLEKCLHNGIDVQKYQFIDSYEGWDISKLMQGMLIRCLS